MDTLSFSSSSSSSSSSLSLPPIQPSPQVQKQEGDQYTSYTVTTLARPQNIPPPDSHVSLSPADDELNERIRSIIPSLWSVFANPETDTLYSVSDLQVIQLTYGDEQFAAFQEERAHLLDDQFHTMGIQLRSQLHVVGWMMIHGERLGIFSYIEGAGRYSSMDEWLDTHGINSMMREHARLLMQAWPYVRDLGKDMEYLLDPQFTTLKLREIVQRSRDSWRQLRAYQASTLAQPQPTVETTVVVEADDRFLSYPANPLLLEEGDPFDEDPQETDHLVSSPSMSTVSPVVHTPNPALPKEVVTTMLADLEHLRSLSNEDFKIERNATRGKQVAPQIYCYDLTLGRDGRLHGSVIIEPTGDDSLKDAMKMLERGSKPSSVTYSVKGLDGTLDGKGLAKWLLEGKRFRS